MTSKVTVKARGIKAVTLTLRESSMHDPGNGVSSYDVYAGRKCIGNVSNGPGFGKRYNPWEVRHRVRGIETSVPSLDIALQMLAVK